MRQMIPVILIIMLLQSALTDTKRSDVLMVSDTRRSKRINLCSRSPDNHASAVKFSNERTVLLILPVTIFEAQTEHLASARQRRRPFSRCSRAEDGLNFHPRQKQRVRRTAADENGRGRKKRREGSDRNLAK